MNDMEKGEIEREREGEGKRERECVRIYEKGVECGNGTKGEKRNTRRRTRNREEKNRNTVSVFVSPFP